MPTSALLGDHGNVRSSKKPKFATNKKLGTLRPNDADDNENVKKNN